METLRHDLVRHRLGLGELGMDRACNIATVCAGTVTSLIHLLWKITRRGAGVYRAQTGDVYR